MSQGSQVITTVTALPEFCEATVPDELPGGRYHLHRCGKRQESLDHDDWHEQHCCLACGLVWGETVDELTVPRFLVLGRN